MKKPHWTLVVGLIMAAAFGLAAYLTFGEAGQGFALYGAGLLFGLGALPSVIGFTWDKLGINQLFWAIFLFLAVAFSVFAGTAGLGTNFAQAVLADSRYVTVTYAGGSQEDFLIQGSEVGNVSAEGRFVSRGSISADTLLLDGSRYHYVAAELLFKIPYLGVEEGFQGIILIEPS